jgi:hypothetical protein
LAGLVVISGSTSSVSVAPVGKTVEVVLTSASYGRDGRLVPWGLPTSSSPGVLAPTGAPGTVECPADATCTFFVARSPGSATVSTVGPSGILCTKEKTRCIGVAAVLRRFAVRVVGV